MEKNNQNQSLIGEVTGEQIAKWKEAPGVKQVHAIEIDGHVCYVKHPDRNTVSYALRYVSFKMKTEQEDGAEIEINMGDSYKKGEAVLLNCWLGGSEEIKNDTDLWVGACIAAGNLITYKNGELKNL